MPLLIPGSAPIIYQGGTRYRVRRMLRAGTVIADYTGSTGTVPTNTAVPALSGTPRVGQALTIFDGTWSGTTPMTAARRVQYSADGSTGWTTTSTPSTASYTPTAAREGQYLRPGVQMTNSAGTSAWVYGPVVGPVAAANTATGLLSGTTWPSQSQAQPTDLIPSNARLFATSAPYIATVPSGLTFGSTGAVFDGSTTAATVLEITLPTALVAGRRYGLLLGMPERTAGNVNVTLMPGNVSPEGAGLTAPRNFTRAFVATQAHTTVRIAVTAGANLRMNYIDLVDMTSLLAKKWRIAFIFDAQSNIVGAESSDVDWSIERPELRAVYIPGVANTPFGATFDANGVGKPLIVQDPLQHSTTNAGGGPMGAFVRRMTDSLRDDEILVLVATGWAGTGRLNSGYWNRDGSDFRAWTNMLTQLRGAQAQAPTGSTVAGALQCGHEADVSVNSATLLPAAVERDIADLRAEFGNFPVVMMEIGTQNVSANQVAQQDAMEALAGRLDRCRYIRRPAGATFRPDGIHYDQATNRIRGAAAAEAMLEMSYGSARPSTGTAPSFTTAASISPASGAVGTVFTISNGAVTGTPTPTVTRTLTQNGVDVTSQISGGQFTSTAAGPLALTVTASNGVSPAATSTASATISASGGGAIANTLTNPPVSERLSPIDDKAFRPFVNAFKQSEGWRNGNWSGGWAEAQAAGYINANGVVKSVPASGLVNRCLVELPAVSGASGHWRLTWTGAGSVSVNGGSNVTQVNANRIEFDYTANGSNAIIVQVNSRTTDLGSFRLAHQDDWAADDAGKLFRDQFIAEVRNYRCIRFDEWSGVLLSVELGGLKITTWASRAQPADEVYYRFVPYEVMFQLCQEVGADPWICLPTASTDDHFTGAANLFKAQLQSPRRLYVELSTKVWDWAGTAQTQWFADGGRAAYGTSGSYTQEHSSFYGQRFVRMAQIFRSIWGSGTDLQLVIQAHADSPQTDYEWLEAPMWRDSNASGLPAYVAPYTLANVLTVHAQIDGGMGYGGMRTYLDNWRNNLTQTQVFDRMRDQMLTTAYYDDPVWDQRSVAQMTDKWTQWRTIANNRGLTLACYEFGNHLNDIGGTNTNDVYSALAGAFSVSSQMGEVYTQAFAAARTRFNGPICFSTLCRTPDKDAVRGMQRYLGDHNPAWQAMETINQGNDGPAGRGATAFIGTAEVAS